MTDERYTITAVQKALRILEILMRDDNGHSFTSIVNASGGMNKSNVLRILATLKQEGFISFDEEKNEYYLGPVFLNFRNYAGCLHLNIENELKEAADQTGMIVHYTVFRNGELRLAFRVFPQTSFESLALASIHGDAVPLNATGAGKIYAAFAESSVRNELMKNCAFKSYSPQTITDRKVFEQVVRGVREDGFALNHCEHEEFLCCLSRPVFSSGGHLAGALSFSGLKDMFTGSRYEMMKEVSATLADSLSRRFGYDCRK